jgi:hypothetical protein
MIGAPSAGNQPELPMVAREGDYSGLSRDA